MARLIDPAWRGRVSYLLLGLMLLWPLLQLTEFRVWALFNPESLRQTGQFLASMFPPDVSASFLHQVLRETWHTIAMATAGMTFALIVAVPLTVVAVRVLSISTLSGRMHVLPLCIRELVRAILVFLRSVPELIWALIFVRVVGLGPTAGVLAIGLTYAGMLGKVYAEIFESGETVATKALLQQGAGRLQALFYALLPQNSDELISYTVYRFECAIRSSAVLGFVGAGGLGQMMDASLKMFNGAEVCTILMVFLLLVRCADWLSVSLRRGLA